MTLLGIAQIVIFFALVLAVTKPVGIFMFRVFEGQRTFLHPVLRPVERLIYWLGGVQENVEQTWVRYTASLISLSTFCFLLPYAIQRLQGLLPLNPMHFSTGQAPMSATPMTPDLAFNTAVSFMTNTNWQAYSPDTRLRAPYDEDHREFLGGCDARHRVHPPAHFNCGGPVFCLAGIDSKLQAA